MSVWERHSRFELICSFNYTVYIYIYNVRNYTVSNSNYIMINVGKTVIN